MSRTEIGIDLGSYEIKIAYVQGATKNENSELNHLKKSACYPVVGKMYSQEYFSSVRNAIKDFSKKIKKKRLSLNFAIPYNKKTGIMALKVAKAEEKDVTLGVRFEAEQLTGISYNKHKTLWKKITDFPEEKQMEVLFASVDSKLMSQISKFKTVNWKVNRVIHQPVVLERFAKKNDIVLDFGYKSSRIYMYRNGRLFEVETLPVGFYHLEEKTKEFLQERAIEVEDFYGLMDKIEMSNDFVKSELEGLELEVSNNLEPMILNLISETKKVVRSFELKNGLMLDTIFLTGSLFEIKYLSDVVSSELDLETRTLETVAKNTEETKYEIASLISIPYKKEEKLNFAQFARTNVDYTSMATGVATVALSAGLILSGLNHKYEDLVSSQERTLSEQSRTMETITTKSSQYEEIIRSSRDYIQKVEQISGDNEPWLSSALVVIPELTPLTISVTNMEVDGSKIVLKGYSSDYSSIGFFANKLEDFGTVNISSIKNYSKKKKKYTVTTENPEDVSKKYLVTKQFEMTVEHNGSLTR